MKHYWIILISLLVIIVCFLIITYICFSMTFLVRKKDRIGPYDFLKGPQYEVIQDKITLMIDSVISIPYEDVYIKSHDGLKLHARYYHNKDNAPIQILFHGYKSNSIRDFSGGLKLTLDRGFNVILVDQRAHGQSEGKYLSFGILEKYDALQWINYAINRFGNNCKIVLTGISMGASTILMSTSLPLPSNVIALVADCGYSSIKKIICKVIKSMKLPVKITYFFIRMSGIIYGHFDINKHNTYIPISKTNLPIIFIHGKEDRFVPVEMTYENYKYANEKCVLFTVKDAGHGLCYVIDYDRYYKVTSDFFNQILN